MGSTRRDGDDNLSRGSIISEDSHPADEEDYYEEDKEAYEKGLSTVFEPMNPDAIPDQINVMVDEKTGTHHKKIVAQMVQEK